MVSSTHWLATQCGMAVLEQGGNAFDAAVAAGVVLQVVEPHLNGLGGDLPILLWDLSHRRVEVISGQGPGPKPATLESITPPRLARIPATRLASRCRPRPL